jgi:hypothetical protein
MTRWLLLVPFPTQEPVEPGAATGSCRWAMTTLAERVAALLDGVGHTRATRQGHSRAMAVTHTHSTSRYQQRGLA